MNNTPWEAYGNVTGSFIKDKNNNFIAQCEDKVIAEYIVNSVNTIKGHCGITLRDYFAGQALAGLLNNEKFATYDDKGHYCAGICYQMAEMMLKIREDNNYGT